MIVYCVLDAFESEIKKNNKLLNNLKNKGFLPVFMLIIAIILIFISMIFSKNNILAILFSFLSFIFINIFDILDNKCTRDQYMTTAKKRNEYLDILKVILSKDDFNNIYNVNDINSKIKLKQLLYKCLRELNKRKQNKSNKIEDTQNKLALYILPIITFFMGNAKLDLNINEAVSYILMIIIPFISIYILVKSITKFSEFVNTRSIYKLQNLTNYLQDLLDRDFEVTEDDLLEIDE